MSESVYIVIKTNEEAEIEDSVGDDGIVDVFDTSEEAQEYVESKYSSVTGWHYTSSTQGARHMRHHPTSEEYVPLTIVKWYLSSDETPDTAGYDERAKWMY